MKTLFFVLLIALSSTACTSHKAKKQQNLKPIITFQKTACFGKCPVYSLEIFADGKIKYKGEKNTDKIGEYVKSLSKDEIKSLKESFISADFFSFKDEYTSKKTDLPTTYISFENEGKYKKVKDYSDAPEPLKNLERMIEKIVASDGWEKIQKK